MKRKLIATIMLSMVVVLLAGCDFFGGGQQTTIPPLTTTEPIVTTTEQQTVTTEENTTTENTTTESTTTESTTTAQQIYYTVVFLDGDGSTLDTQSVLEGGSATEPTEEPTKAPTAEYSYTFTNWDQDFDNVTSNMVINPVFAQTVNQYTVTFQDYDGTVLDTQSVDYGSGAIEPTQPTRAGDAEHSYTFDHWDVAFNYITGDLTVTAVYTESINVYTVAFYDYDGTLIISENVSYGSDAPAPAAPYRESDATNAFTFIGWDADLTNITSDLDVHALYMPVPLGQTYEVNFYDGDGKLIDTQVVNHGEDATAPTTVPTKEEDAQYTYTFHSWNQPLTNIDKNMDIYPIFEETSKEYTVTFYDAEGNVIETQTVVYGNEATAPADPTKEDDESYSYTFIGWDENYFYITGDLDVYPQFFRTPLGEFNRDDLIDIVDDMFTPDDVDEQIAELMVIIGASSEEELYNIMLAMQQLMMNLMDINSAGALQEWFQATQILGFDRDTVVDIVYNLMVSGFANDISHMSDRIAELTGLIEDENFNISDFESQMTTISNQVDAYCQIQNGYTDLCEDYFNAQIDANMLQEDYYDMFDYEFPEIFDYSTYYNLEWKLDEFLTESILNQDVDAAQQALDELNAMIASINQDEEMDLYQPILDAYEDMKTAEYAFQLTDYSSLDVLGLGDDFTIRDYIDDALWGYDNEFGDHIDGYMDLISNKEFSEWLIIEYTQDLENINFDAMDTQAILNYITSDDGETETKVLIGTVYDGLEAVIGSIDEETYQLVMTIVNESMGYSEPGYTPLRDYYNPIEQYKDLINPENIVLISEKLNNILSAFMSTMDDSDYDNIKEVIIGYMSEKMALEGATEIQIAGFVSVIGPVIDRYIDYFQFAESQVESFLGSIDQEKAETALSVLSINFYETGPGDIALAIKMSNIYDALLGDGSVDVSQIMQYMAAIYFDVTNEMVPDQAEVARIQGEIDVFISDYLALITQIKDYDPNCISPSQVEDIMEFYARGMAIGRWFEEGFETVDEPLVVFDDEFLYNFLERLVGEEDLDSTIDALMDILGTTDTETTYYTLRSIFQYGIGVMKINNFSDIQVWINNLETFGFTQEDFIEYFLSALTYATEDLNSNFQETLTYLEAQLVGLTPGSFEYESVMEQIDDLYQDTLMGLVMFDLMHDPAYQAETGDVMNIVLDDIKNMITSMPNNSFPMIEKLIGYLKYTMFNPEMSNDPEKGYDPEGIPVPKDDEPMMPFFNPQEIYQLTQELSTFLKLRGDTITPDETILIQSFILNIITVYVDRLDLESSETTEMINNLYAMTIKYIDFADITLTEFTNFLDGLTYDDVEMFMRYMDMIQHGGDNLYTMVILGSQLINSMVDPTEVDLDLLANILNEVYYDQTYGPGYDPADLAALQNAWTDFIDDFMLDVAQAAALDPENLDPDTFADLYELQNKAIFLSNIIVDPEAIFDAGSFGYSYDDLVSLVYNIFPDIDEENVDEKIAELCGVFGIDIENSEEVFYLLMGVAPSLEKIEDIHSIKDLMVLYKGISSFGYTNEEIATYMMNAFMIYVYPQLPDMYDASELLSEIAEIEGLLDGTQISLDDLLTEVNDEISLISDPVAQQAAYDLWQAYINKMDSEIAYYTTYNRYTDDEWFNYDFYNQLVEYMNNGEWYKVDDMLSNYYADDYYMYNDLCILYQSMVDTQSELFNQAAYFESVYGSLLTSDGYSYFTYYLNDRANAYHDLKEMIEDFQVQLNYKYEDLEMLQNNSNMFQMLEILFADPANQDLAIDTLTILLDQIAAYAEDPNIQSLDFLLFMINNNKMPLDMLNAGELSDAFISAGQFIGNMFSTIDDTDETTIKAFLGAIGAAYVGTLDLTDPVEIANMNAAIVATIDLYFADIMDIPTYISTFLESMTFEKTQAVIDQVMIFTSIPNDEYSTINDQYAQVVAVANIIDTLVGDDSLDYASIITPIYSSIYDMNVIFGQVYDDELNVMLGAALDQLDTIVLQSSIVGYIDPYNPSPSDELLIQQVKDMVDGLGQYFIPLFDEEPEV